MIKKEFKELVMKNFELIKGEEIIGECEGAQLIDGKWYMPLGGCDTIQNILDDRKLPLHGK